MNLITREVKTVFDNLISSTKLNMKTRKVIEREFADCWDLVKVHGMELNKLSFIRHEKTSITVMQRSKLLVSSYIPMLLYPFIAKYLRLK